MDRGIQRYDSEVEGRNAIRSVKVVDQHRAWNDLVNRTFVDLQTCPATDEPFRATIESAPLVSVEMSHVTGCAQSVIRTRRHIDCNPSPFFLMNLQLSGSARASQYGFYTHLRPGDFALFDPNRPYEIAFDESFAQIVVKIPQDRVRHYLGNQAERQFSRIRPKTGMGKLASNFIASTYREAPHLSGSEATNIEHCLLEICLSAIRSERSTRLDVSCGESMRQRVRQYVLQNLRSSNLSCKAIAQKHSVSERYLRRLFQNEDESLSTFIRACRLERAKADLTLSGLNHHASITEIAYKWGFSDGAHFSRLFKAKNGLTPREYVIRSKKRQ
ncbi:MAG: helix-turn-helix domain-containing protein [Pseudomonadota bacterium]